LAISQEVKHFPYYIPKNFVPKDNAKIWIFLFLCRNKNPIMNEVVVKYPYCGIDNHFFPPIIISD